MDFWKKNINHFINFINYIFEHLLCIIVLILILVISLVVLRSFPTIMPKDVQSQEIYILGISLNNISIWFTAIGLIFTALWSMYQYTKNKNANQQEKASEIAKSFAEQLTQKCTIISNVFEKSSLFEILDFNNIDCLYFSTFNTNEIRNIYNDDNYISKYKEAKKQANLNTVYYNVLESLISVESYDTIKNNHKSYTTQEARELFILDNANMPFLFDILVYNVLNELEYLCMYLSSQAAGSKYVYQSLHQVFLRTIRVLAIEISISNNKSYSDKYYTNIIAVYNEWKSLYSNGLKKEKSLKAKIEKILNPQIKTV